MKASIRTKGIHAGVVIGLAIYNAHVLNFAFPSAVYQKLLGRPPTLANLRDADPAVFSSLTHLLEYPADRVEADMCLTFQVLPRVPHDLRRCPLLSTEPLLSVPRVVSARHMALINSGSSQVGDPTSSLLSFMHPAGNMLAHAPISSAVFR